MDNRLLHKSIRKNKNDGRVEMRVTSRNNYPHNDSIAGNQNVPEGSNKDSEGKVEEQREIRPELGRSYLIKIPQEPR